MSPSYLSLLVFSSCDYWLGDLAWHWSGCGGLWRCRLDVQVLFRDAALSEVRFGGQGWRRLVEVVKRRVVGEVVWVEVVVIVDVLGEWHAVLLLQVCWCCSGG